MGTTTGEAATELRIEPQRKLYGAERVAVAEMLAKRYRSGQSIRVIAKAVGRSYGFVRLALLMSGVELRARGGSRVKPEAQGDSSEA